MNNGNKTIDSYRSSAVLKICDLSLVTNIYWELCCNSSGHI